MFKEIVYLDSEVKKSYLFLCRWILIASLAGAVGTLSVQSFIFLLKKILSLLLTLSLPIPVWTILGALFTGAIVYRIEAETLREGITSYIYGLRFENAHLAFSVTILKYLAAFLTLSTFGNGGMVGPLGRVSAGITSQAGKLLNFSDEDRRTAAICGLAAVVGTVFHSSIGAGIFAVEIIQRSRLSYKDLFPAILASSIALFLNRMLGWSSLYHLEMPGHFMDMHKLIWIFLLAVITGFAGGAFTSFYAFVARTFQRGKGNVLVKLLVGSSIASLLAWGVNPDLLGTSTAMIRAVLHGELASVTGRLNNLLPLVLILFFMAVVKGVCNCITVGSGMSAGFIGPLSLSGMILGSAVALIADVRPHTATFHAFLAAGFSGLLASSINIPLAATVISIEIFGLHHSLVAGLSAIVAFQMMRHKRIYDYTLQADHPEI